MMIQKIIIYISLIITSIYQQETPTQLYLYN